MAKWKLEVEIEALDLEEAWNIAASLPRDMQPQSMDSITSFKLWNTETSQTVFFGTGPWTPTPPAFGSYPPGVRSKQGAVPQGIYAPGTK